MNELFNTKVLAAVGVPGLIALYLVYYLTTGTSDAHTKIQQGVDNMKDYLWVNCHTQAEVIKSQHAHDRCDDVRDGRTPRGW